MPEQTLLETLGIRRPSLASFQALPQFELLDLASRGFRQFSELECFWAFETGQAVAGEAAEFIGGDGCAVFKFNKRAGDFAPGLVRFGDHGTEKYGRGMHQRAFDLHG